MNAVPDFLLSARRREHGEGVAFRYSPTDQADAHPDAKLLAHCAHLRTLQVEWQRLWEPTTEDWGLDAPPTTPADHEWLAYNDQVWPAVHISGQEPRHPDDMPGRLLDFHPVTVEGLRAKAAAVLAMDDAGCYGGDSRDDACEMSHSVLVDVAGPARMLMGEEAHQPGPIAGSCTGSDAELILVWSHFVDLERRIRALFDGPDALEDLEQAYGALGLLQAKVQPLLTRMEQLSAASPLGIQARAAALAEHNRDFEFSFDDRESLAGSLLEWLMRDVLALGTGEAPSGRTDSADAGRMISEEKWP